MAAGEIGQIVTVAGDEGCDRYAVTFVSVLVLRHGIEAQRNQDHQSHVHIG